MAATSGILTNNICSTVSSPTVHYAAEYTASRVSSSTVSISVDIDFSAWLNTSNSTLGKGIRLTVFARINNSGWYSAVLKNSADAWSGTAKHTANLTLSANTTASKATVEFYVSRTSSSIGGSAGVLGSAATPQSYSISLPVYTAIGTAGVSTPSDMDRYVYVRVNEIWKKAIPYVKVNGTWKKAIAYVKVNGIWKST